MSALYFVLALMVSTFAQPPPPPSPPSPPPPLEHEDDNRISPASSPDPWEFTPIYRPHRSGVREGPRNIAGTASENDTEVFVAVLDQAESVQQEQQQQQPLNLSRPILCNESMPSTSSSSGHESPPRRCLNCDEEVQRSTLRRLSVRHFFENYQQPLRSLTRPDFALRCLDHVHWELSDLVWLLNFMAMSPLQDRLRLATALFSLIQSSLEDIHVMIQTWIGDEQNVLNGCCGPQREQQPPQEVRCLICSAALPTVVFQPCGHVSCFDCSTRLFRCPFCRAPIVGKMHIFF